MAGIKALMVGDAMIPSAGFVAAWTKHCSAFGSNVVAGEWESDWAALQHRRLEVEKHGPDIEPVPELVAQQGSDAQALAGLFVPVSEAVIDAMPALRVVGVCRAGVENVNVPAATARGVAVLHVMGRNAHAVSDFTIGLMLAEARNIARAHYSIKTGQWQKAFSNSDFVPEMHGKTIGLVGFGHIGALVAQKLSGFDVNIIVYDPYVDSAALAACGATSASLDEVMRTADFVSLHARLGDDNRGMIGADQLALMKPTAVIINTARAGLVDADALASALADHRIAGAALDVFDTEPIPPDSPLLKLDNVTLTTHIAGTTADALTNSPFLLMDDISRLLRGEAPQALVNPQVLDDPGFAAWLSSVKAG